MIRAILIIVVALAGCSTPVSRSTELPRVSKLETPEPQVQPEPIDTCVTDVVNAVRRACLTKGGFKIKYEGSIEHFECSRKEEEGVIN